MLKVFEAFAGIGTQRMALRNIGIDFEVVGISEIDKYALKSYEAIHNDCPNYGDISKIDPKTLPKIDLFTYSFPCQDISVAGRQKGIIKGETRSGLLYECEKIIESCKPKYLLMENVKNLIGKKNKSNFEEWLRYLESLGYTNYWDVLNSKNYGVPQNRERVFCISILGEHTPYKFPNPIKLDKKIKDMLEDNVDEKYYMDKPFKFVDKGHQAELEMKGMDCIKRVYSIDNVCPTLTTMGGGHREPKILIPQATKKGYIDMDVPGVCDLSFPNSKTRRGRVQDGGKICPTLTTSNQDIVYIERVERTPLKFLNRNGKKTGEDYTFCVDTCHTGGIKEIYNNNEYRVRKLTPKECFRLMGVSDEDIEKIQSSGISNAQQYKQAGNSIVVAVLENIFKELFINE